MKINKAILFLSFWVTAIVGYISYKPDVKIAQPTTFDFSQENPAILTEGFYNPEKWGRWTKGNSANITFKVIKPVDTKISFNSWFYTNPKHPELIYTLFINGNLYIDEVETKREKNLVLDIKSWQFRYKIFRYGSFFISSNCYGRS